MKLNCILGLTAVSFFELIGKEKIKERPVKNCEYYTYDSTFLFCDLEVFGFYVTLMTILY